MFKYIPGATVGAGGVKDSRFLSLVADSRFWSQSHVTARSLRSLDVEVFDEGGDFSTVGLRDVTNEINVVEEIMVFLFPAGWIAGMPLRSEDMHGHPSVLVELHA